MPDPVCPYRLTALGLLRARRLGSGGGRCRGWCGNRLGFRRLGGDVLAAVGIAEQLGKGEKKGKEGKGARLELTRLSI